MAPDIRLKIRASGPNFHSDFLALVERFLLGCFLLVPGLFGAGCFLGVRVSLVQFFVVGCFGTVFVW